MTLIGITVHSWLYEGSCALENMVLGMEERAVRDGGNHLSKMSSMPVWPSWSAGSDPTHLLTLDRLLASTAATHDRSGTAARIADRLRVRPLK